MYSKILNKYNQKLMYKEIDTNAYKLIKTRIYYTLVEVTIM
jgi:hypothetical protein